MHSCRSFPIEQHFTNKDLAKNIYEELFTRVNEKIGTCQVVSLPCCIHWFGTYDFIALLPKKDKLEIRFALDKELNSPRIYTAVPLSSTSFKNCLYIDKIQDIDSELLKWIKESYFLKEKAPAKKTP